MTLSKSVNFGSKTLSIPTLWVLILVFIVLLPIIVIELYSFETFSNSLNDSSFEKLDSIAMINSHIIESFFENKILEIESTKTNKIINENMPILTKFANEKTNLQYIDAKKNVDNV